LLCHFGGAGGSITGKGDRLTSAGAVLMESTPEERQKQEINRRRADKPHENKGGGGESPKKKGKAGKGLSESSTEKGSCFF